MTVYDWPSTLRPTDVMIPVLEGNAASAGPSITAQERFLVTDAGLWRYGFRVDLRTPKQIMSWRAIVAVADGHVNPIRVPICDGLFDPAAMAGIRGPIVRAIRAAPVTYSGGVTHSDGSGFGASITLATVASTKGPGQTSIRVTMPTGLVPQPGQYFGDGDRFYRIKSAALVSGSTYDLKFLPRLRQTIMGGSEVSFDKLYCLMRIADESLLRTDLRTLRYGELNLEFIEVVT